ncbi:MAG: hypothetical protein OQK59_05530, partial [Chlorobium sp.]|nr:hypothetical protein [Chlorobium sp.]
MKDRSSYTPFFFAFLSLLLLALTVWVIWKDEIQLRPWKEYQQEYKELKASKLQSEYDEAVTLFQSSGDAQKLESLKARLDETDRIFQSKEVQDKYKGLAAQKDIVEASLDENQKQLQEKRGKFLQVEYLYIRDQREQDKKTMQVLQNEIGSLTENRDALLKQKNSIEEKIGDLTKDREALLAEMQSLRKGLDEKLAAIESNERMSEGIQQVHIRDADKADRCITCHIGIESSYRLTDSQPLTPHPARFVYL